MAARPCRKAGRVELICGRGAEPARRSGTPMARVPSCRAARSTANLAHTHVLPNVEVTGPERHGAWAARRNIDNERFAAQVPCRGGSG